MEVSNNAPTADKQFLDLINKKGFILEERVKTVLMWHIPSYQSVCCPFTFGFKGERIEIDEYLLTNVFEALIECKKTSQTWFFVKNKSTPSLLNSIYSHPKDGYIMHSRIPAKSEFEISTGSYEFAAASINGKWELRNQDDSSYQSIHKAIIQILKNTESFLQCGDVKRNIGVFLVPIIVTNAPIYLLEVNDEDIDENGNLSKLALKKEVGYLAFNFHTQLRFGRNGEEAIKYIGGDVSEPLIVSVYIVNVLHLKEFIENISKWLALNKFVTKALA